MLDKLQRPLIVVAHPDDETLFFGGLILALAGRADVLCVTDGNFKGNGDERREALRRAAKVLGVHELLQWAYHDHPAQSLPVEEITAALVELQAKRNYDCVFTHAPHGDYGHFNHMDVSIAVHRAFDGGAPVYVISGLLHPHLRVALTPDAYERKLAISTSVYLDELRNARLFAVQTADEGFTRLSREEAESVYSHCAEGQPVEESALAAYRACFALLRTPTCAAASTPTCACVTLGGHANRPSGGAARGGAKV